ncbi:hypothetical protein UY3_12956 [Chelonia mydas]|uniref:Uncharacterized protein n=1 Tax=Chelonia mydas TaxID=8469 RepID=M7AYY9_CHEMY|nr:hypothetical protein UY3_12956 [Chelonia mydas]
MKPCHMGLKPRAPSPAIRPMLKPEQLSFAGHPCGPIALIAIPNVDPRFYMQEKQLFWPRCYSLRQSRDFLTSRSLLNGLYCGLGSPPIKQESPVNGEQTFTPMGPRGMGEIMPASFNSTQQGTTQGFPPQPAVVWLFANYREKLDPIFKCLLFSNVEAPKIRGYVGNVCPKNCSALTAHPTPWDATRCRGSKPRGTRRAARAPNPVGRDALPGLSYAAPRAGRWLGSSYVPCSAAEQGSEVELVRWGALLLWEQWIENTARAQCSRGWTLQGDAQRAQGLAYSYRYPGDRELGLRGLEGAGTACG